MSSGLVLKFPFTVNSVNARVQGPFCYADIPWHFYGTSLRSPGARHSAVAHALARYGLAADTPREQWVIGSPLGHHWVTIGSPFSLSKWLFGVCIRCIPHFRRTQIQGFVMLCHGKLKNPHRNTFVDQRFHTLV